MMVGFGIMSIVAILAFVFSAGLFILHIALCVWAYRDAIRHGRSREFALLVLVALLFFPIVGLIVYLVIRGD